MTPGACEAACDSPPWAAASHSRVPDARLGVPPLKRVAKKRARAFLAESTTPPVSPEPNVRLRSTEIDAGAGGLSI